MTTITQSVVRTYIEMNREQFEKLTSSGISEQKQKQIKRAEMQAKWDKLNLKHRVIETPS